MNGFLDLEEDTSMPVDGSLLNAPSGEEMARSLCRTAIALAAAQIADVSYTSRLLENQLDNALVFLASDECPPAKQLHEKLSICIAYHIVTTKCQDSDRAQSNEESPWQMHCFA